MRRSSLVSIGTKLSVTLGLTLAALPSTLAACRTTSDTSPPGATPVEAEGGTATPPDAGPLPTAHGNPCRGVPVPSDQAYVPPGMCASVVGAALGAIRQITFAPNGDIFFVTTQGTIKRMHDADGDGFYQVGEVSIWAETGGNGNNCDLDVANGYLYAGGPNGVKRWAWSPTAATGGVGEDVVTGQPSGGHSKRTVRTFGGYLYVGSGSAGNVTNTKAPAYDDTRSLIRRFALASFTPGAPFDWMTGELVTQGLRNPNGITINAAGKMFAVVNGMDDVGYAGQNVHNDNPGEQIVEIAMGKQYGYPFCFTAQRVALGGQVIAPGTQLALSGGPHDDAWCLANSAPPATFVQAHSAPLDIGFFDSHPKGGLPERYRGGAFVALHGSWDRTPATGYKVIWVPFDAAGKPPMPTSTMTDTTFPYETVFGGGNEKAPNDGPWSWMSGDYSDQPRFAGAIVSPVDGALYVTTDAGGYLYRIGIPNP